MSPPLSKTAWDERGLRRWIPKLDAIGITLSGLCAIHCATLPLLMLALPLVGSHEFEEALRWSIGGLGVVVVGMGVWSHRNLRAVPPLVMALLLFVACAFEGAHGTAELVLSLLGSACLITAHWLNTTACRAHGRARKRSGHVNDPVIAPHSHVI